LVARTVTFERKGTSSLKRASEQEIVESCRSVADSLGLAHDLRSARWFTDVPEVLGALPQNAWLI
jgi:hypothetical protein